MKNVNSGPAFRPCLSGHVPALNAMRGIAVLLVFLFHAGVPGFSGAFIGVDIFFVLSGFLITVLLLQEYQDNGAIILKKFYMRRVLRLMPGLVLFLIVFVLFSLFYFKSPSERLTQLQDALITLFDAANWTRAFDLNRPGILGHCWSLSVEEQFYVLWPFMTLFLLRLSNCRRSISIAVLFLFPWGQRLYLLNNGASWNRLYNGLDCRADMLLAGCLLASLWNGGYLNFWESSRLLRRFLIWSSAVTLVFFSFLADWQEAALYEWQYSMIAMATTVVILELITCPRGSLGNLLNRKLLVWLGTVSYGIYLWHYPIIYFMGGAGLGRVLFVFCAALLTVVFTSLSWYGIELPFQRLKKHFQANSNSEGGSVYVRKSGIENLGSR